MGYSPGRHKRVRQDLGTKQQQFSQWLYKIMTLNCSLLLSVYSGYTYNLQNFIYLEQCPLITEIFSVDFDPKVTGVSHTSYQYNHYKP